jgi:nitroreductase
MTDKPAPNQYPIHDLLRHRWSPRAFSARPVAAASLNQLLEAARWAASCFNEQPWRYIVAPKSQPADYERLLSCLVSANQVWAQQAPVLMLAIAKLTFTHNGSVNRHAYYDVGAATTTLALQATAMGLFIHQMAGFDADKARTLFQIPADYDPVAAIAVGYPGDASTLSAELAERERAPRTRRPVSEFVFYGSFGQG